MEWDRVEQEEDRVQGNLRFKELWVRKETALSVGRGPPISINQTSSAFETSESTLRCQLDDVFAELEDASEFQLSSERGQSPHLGDQRWTGVWTYFWFHVLFSLSYGMLFLSLPTLLSKFHQIINHGSLSTFSFAISQPRHSFFKETLPEISKNGFAPLQYALEVTCCYKGSCWRWIYRNESRYRRSLGSCRNDVKGRSAVILHWGIVQLGSFGCKKEIAKQTLKGRFWLVI
jgi:hypothetical protein